MAEIAISLVVELLGPFLVEEMKQIKGVNNSEIRSIKDEMEFIRVFLRDADAKAETNEHVKIWVRQVRQVAFRMEDVLDEFSLRLAQPSHHLGWFGWIRKTLGSVKHLTSSRVVAREIQDIKANLHEISQRRERYQFNSSVSEAGSSSNNNRASWQYRRDDALYVEESELVGIERHKNELLSWLVEGEVRRTVLAVVGMGGVGKTTLVRKAYKSPIVLNHFECQAWITVSQSFQMEELLIKLINQFQGETFSMGIRTMERTQLIDKLREHLHKKRYVVVLDDVWNVELWNFLKHALLDNHCGSRIIITTRTDEVASSSVESSTDIYYLHPLNLNDALVLFYKKAFRSNSEGLCPPELVDLSKKIVKKSGGLPLAIVAMGGVLLMKESVLEWKKFHDSLSFKLEEDPSLKSIMKVISLSYHDLPYRLKSCFLYFGVLPEDSQIFSFQLVSLWIAEGFVKERPGETLEEVAEEYLDQLISRNLVQVDDEFPIYGHFRLCKVHDLMREFILSRCANEDFCEVLDENSVASSNESIRRLSIQNSIGIEGVVENMSSRVRALFVFELNNLSISLICKLLSRLVLLKVLNLAGAPLEKFPREITRLYHLKFLSLNGTHIRKLPNTVAKLQNLETLFLANTRLVELPLAILKLKKLRHIEASHIQKDPLFMSIAVNIPEEIGCLTSLQTLCCVDVNQGTNLIKNLGKLSEMRFLMVENLRRESGSELCASISKMNHLQSLGVTSLKEDVLDLQFPSSPPSLLKMLYLSGPLEKLPDWIISLSNLNKINLNFLRLRDEPLKVLQGLPNLIHICLMNHAYDGEELYFEAGSFLKLKILALSKADNLHSLIIEKGAMPNLKELFIQNCEQLKVVPNGISHLMNVKILSFFDMPEDFMRRLDQDQGEDYWKVKHVPALLLVNGGIRIGPSTNIASMRYVLCGMQSR